MSRWRHNVVSENRWLHHKRNFEQKSLAYPTTCRPITWTGRSNGLAVQMIELSYTFEHVTISVGICLFWFHIWTCDYLRWDFFILISLFTLLMSTMMGRNPPPRTQQQDDMKTKCKRYTPRFCAQAIHWDERECCTTKPEVGKPIWRPLNRKYPYLSL